MISKDISCAIALYDLSNDISLHRKGRTECIDITDTEKDPNTATGPQDVTTNAAVSAASALADATAAASVKAAKI